MIIKEVWIGREYGSLVFFGGKTKPKKSKGGWGGFNREGFWSFCLGGWRRTMPSLQLKENEVRRYRITIEEVAE